MFRSIRAVVALALAVIIVMGLSQAAKVTNAQADNKAVIQKYVDALNAAFKSGDPSPVAAFYAPDYKSETGETVDVQLAGMKTTAKGFPDGKFELKDIVAEGDKVIARIAFTATNTGDLAGLGAATGKAVKIDTVTGITLKDGKFVSDWSISDNFQLLSQLGWTLTPPMAATPAK